ncbi:XdhC family protein [Micromonospora sp. DR5-3]|uniref:XdhC family protein n=1 Tax=Micromonospora sp. DR5-3 TaxID=2992129 RepID=UPI002231A196|nr:XdhC/CoxI family protein [Micromonospora sp. DR5-3]MCW3818804.1 XdhC family protein [Micromonospora sp. DR5-3]
MDSKRRAGQSVVLARLVARNGPGSRPLGSTMAVAADGTWRGSVSGGCVESIVVEAARSVLHGAAPHILAVSPGEQLLPWEERPACTATLEVLIAPAPPAPVHDAITEALANDRPVTVRVGLRPPYNWSVTPITEDAVAGHDYLDQLPSRRQLLLVGATDLAAVMAGMAHLLDWAVVVVDPRPDHVAAGAMPPTARVERAWPDIWLAEHPLGPQDAVVTLSHDPRIDDRAIRAALAGDAGHVAALGSRATHAQRMRRLASQPGLDRLVGPAGLDLGGASLAETALSILAETVAAKSGRSGRRLRDGTLPIRAAETATAHG